VPHSSQSEGWGTDAIAVELMKHGTSTPRTHPSSCTAASVIAVAAFQDGWPRLAEPGLAILANGLRTRIANPRPEDVGHPSLLAKEGLVEVLESLRDARLSPLGKGGNK